MGELILMSVTFRLDYKLYTVLIYGFAKSYTIEPHTNAFYHESKQSQPLIEGRKKPV